MNVKKLLIIIFVCSLSLASYANDEEILREIKIKLWPKSYKTQNVELLNEILHDSFIMIDATGNYSTKAKEIEYIKNNKWDPEKFTYKIKKLEIYQEKFAIIAGEGNTEKYTYESSNHFVKENGKWKAISSHVSGYKEKAK